VIISGSDFITELVKKYYPDKILKKTVKIPFGIDETLFKPYERTNKGNHPLTLVNIANVSLVKDHVTLLKSILKVREKFPGVTLLHYGKDEKNILVNMVRDLGLENNVRIDGFLDYKHIADTLRKADIYVLSSLYESQNMSIIEAALCGLPVVSTNAGAAKEITDNIVKFGDSTALADMIIKTSENLEIEKRKAVSNIDLLKVNYSLKSSSEKFVELYRSLTGS
jgi:glycosyltransferase involved in cell wall biosynthesis